MKVVGTRGRLRVVRRQEDFSPMEGVGNMADAMLVFACGLLLALILSWKLDITTVSAQEPEPTEAPIAIDEQDMRDTDTQELDQEKLQRVGALYYDEESGVFYAVTGD